MEVFYVEFWLWVLVIFIAITLQSCCKPAILMIIPLSYWL